MWGLAEVYSLMLSRNCRFKLTLPGRVHLPNRGTRHGFMQKFFWDFFGNFCEQIFLSETFPKFKGFLLKFQQINSYILLTRSFKGILLCLYESYRDCFGKSYQNFSNNSFGNSFSMQKFLHFCRYRSCGSVKNISWDVFKDSCKFCSDISAGILFASALF